MNGLDQTIFRDINGWPDSLEPFFVFLSEATKRPAGLALLVVLFLSLIAFKKTRVPALLCMLAWPISDGLTNILKKTLQWPRPSWPEVLLQNPTFHVRVEPLTSPGTASAHSANMMAVAVCFLWLYQPVGWVWFALAILTGISRVYVGVHWPSQVLFGWICGAAMATIVVKSYQAIIASRNPEPVPEEHPEEP